MKFCPMCGTSQFESGATVCFLCDYEEKPYDELSDQEICELMAPYEYETTESGIRILGVKSSRSASLRGSVGIPHFVSEIAAGAFSSSKFLSRIGLPNNLRSIGEYAFAGCRDLFDVFIPESVSYIGKGAFADCYDLSVICAAAPEQPEGWDSEWLLDSCAKVEWSSIYEE